MSGFLLVPASTQDDRIGHQQLMRVCPRLSLTRITALRAYAADDDLMATGSATTATGAAVEM